MSKQAKATDMREKSENELLNRERDLIQQLFKLRFQKATGSAENPSKIRMVKREIARVKTVLGEKRRQVGEKKEAVSAPAASVEKKAASAKRPAAKRAPKKASARRAEGQQS